MLFDTRDTGKRTSVRPARVTFKDPTDHSQPTGQPYLPIDTPPRYPGQGNFPPVVMQGLVFDANLHGQTPVDRPYGPFVPNPQFPLASPSAAGPAAVGTRIGYAINHFSPASHLAARMRREGQAGQPGMPVAVGSQKFKGISMGARRLRGRVVPQPQAVPTWLTPGGRIVH